MFENDLYYITFIAYEGKKKFFWNVYILISIWLDLQNEAHTLLIIYWLSTNNNKSTFSSEYGFESIVLKSLYYSPNTSPKDIMIDNLQSKFN